MNQIRIKTAGECDLSNIVAMIRDFAAFENLSEFCTVTEGRLREAMFGENASVEGLIAFDENNQPVGYALFFPNYASFHGQRGLYLEDLWVAPDAQNRGVGFALIKRLAEIAKSRGCERLDWNVLDWNEKAIKFYKRLGAQIDESERHFKLLGEDFEKLANVDG